MLDQLKRWQSAGYCVLLEVDRGNNWVLVISTDVISSWNGSGINPGTQRKQLRFVTDAFDTPEAAIAQAMEVIR